MSDLVRYELADAVATVTMDDGKVNALGPGMLGEVGAALDRAEDDGAIVVLAGREGIFSGGFDLKVLNAGGPDAAAMLRAGFTLSERLLSFPTPVVVACPGHAIAMGLFLALSGDYLVGADGPYRITANEVAIGLTLPFAAIEILRQRLAPAHLLRAANLAEVYAPADAVSAGLLDRIVAPGEVVAAARSVASGFRQLDLAAHVATKLRTRAGALEALRRAISSEFGA